ncbi:MAG: site-specific integrase [Lachnospiraceae bacterium]|nr:site-specific integrase [Lachnospiraceae bacterium]
MEVGLDKYIDYKVKTVQTIKNNYGFRVILKYEDGSSKTQQRAGFATKKEAEEERCITIGQLKNRTYLVYGNMLVKDYFEHWYEDDIKKRVGSYNTIYNYGGVIRNHIVPMLGNKRMSALNSADIIRLYNKVYKYSESVAYQVKTIVNTCLNYAIDERAVEVNVADGIALPKGIKKKSYHSRVINTDKTLNHQQIVKLINGSKNTPIHLMVLFNVIMGLRCSEIIGLKYSDVDFMRQKLSVERQLGRDKNISKEIAAPKTYTKQEIAVKTYSSKRELDIPDIVFEAILKEKKRYETNKSRRKKYFQDLEYICCSSYGRPRGKTYHFKHFKQLLQDLDLPDVRWHDLRATASTTLLVAGFSPKAVSKLMGHSKEILCVDTYGDERKMAAIKLDRLNSFIESIIPVETKENGNELGAYKIVVDEYISATPQVEQMF